MFYVSKVGRHGMRRWIEVSVIATKDIMHKRFKLYHYVIDVYTSGVLMWRVM